MNTTASTILAVTDLTSASYKLVGFAAFIAGLVEAGLGGQEPPAIPASG